MTNAELKFMELVSSQLKTIAKQLEKLNENIAKLTEQNTSPKNRRTAKAAQDHPVTTICYGEKKDWSSRKKAMEFFKKAMINSEGAEHERYFKIWTQLQDGKAVCKDN